jgi:hypothetical protein
MKKSVVSIGFGAFGLLSLSVIVRVALVRMPRGIPDVLPMVKLKLSLPST